MGNGEQSLNDLLKQAKENMNKVEAQHDLKSLKEKGIVPACKVCRSEKRELMEDLREQGLSYREVLETVNLSDEISLMGLQRHMKNHYPKLKYYKNHERKMKLEAVQEAIKDYPYLKPLFDEDAEDFINNFYFKKGFCVSGCRLCGSIPKQTISNYGEAMESFDTKISDLANNGFLKDNDIIRDLKLDYLQKKFNCLLCSNTQDKTMIIILFRMLDYKFDLQGLSYSELSIILKYKYKMNISKFGKDLANGELMKLDVKC